MEPENITELRPPCVVHVAGRNQAEWHQELQQRLEAAHDVDVIGLDCASEHDFCSTLAAIKNYDYSTSQRYGVGVARFRNRRTAVVA